MPITPCLKHYAKPHRSCATRKRHRPEARPHSSSTNALLFCYNWPFYVFFPYLCRLIKTLIAMALDNEKIIGEGLTYDDVLLVPSYSNVLPRETSLKTKFSRHIDLNIPVVSAGMDTVTESRMAIAIAQEGGIGVLHKNMTIGKQAAEVRKVKRAENGMISDPVTIHVDATVKDALDLMSEYHIGGIPVVDSCNVLVGIVTNRDLRF